MGRQCTHPAQAAPFAAIALKVSRVRRSRHGLCFSPKVRRDARTVWNRARPSLARALPRRHSGLARLRSPLWLRSLPAGLLANARPPLPATAARQLPRLASRVAALRASARNVRHPARASCCDALCRLARSLNVALRAQSPRPASLRSPAPRPATANAFASLSPPRKPSRSIFPPCARRRRESAAIVPLLPRCPAHVARHAPPAWNGSRGSRSWTREPSARKKADGGSQSNSAGHGRTWAEIGGRVLTIVLKTPLETLIFTVSPSCRGGERVKGIEPSYAAWEAAVLPLNYTRISLSLMLYCQETMSSGASVEPGFRS